MKRAEINQVFGEFETWVNDSATWENDLDGLSGVDLAFSAASRFKSMLLEACDKAEEQEKKS
jgi:hypothetical protein